VSGMFRDPGFFLAFRRRVVPILRTYPHVKIWHAGCATGEEVYAMAILLAEESLYERCQIYATDVSARALESAREGVYDQGEVEDFEVRYRASGGRRRFHDYYSAAYGRIALKGALRKNVVFFQHDLVSDFDIGQVHVILCRNVLIYFGSALRDRVLEMFAGALCRGGFLCLGSSERLRSLHTRSFDDFAPLERIYRNRGES
jgi:chemotaxis protein methyltransferase CheR